MRTKYLNLGIFSLLFALVLYGCGGGSGGAPGSTDSGDTGIIIKSVSAIGNDGFTDDAGELEVDTAIHLCPPDFTKAEKGLFMANATLVIDAAKVNPNLISDPFPASVEHCTITYFKANEDPSAPIIPSLTIYPNCQILDATDNKCIVTLMDIQRKNDFWTNAHNGLTTPSEFPTHYIAQYNCEYTGQYGKSGNFVVEYGMWLADWDHCQ